MGSLLRAQWDRVAAWVTAGLGALLLLLGYFKVSGTAYPAEQIPYLVSAGLGALFLLGIAGSLWISADLRDEYAKLDEIARALSASEGQRAAPRDSAISVMTVQPLNGVEHAGAQPARTARRVAREARSSTPDAAAATSRA